MSRSANALLALCAFLSKSDIMSLLADALISCDLLNAARCASMDAPKALPKLRIPAARAFSALAASLVALTPFLVSFVFFSCLLKIESRASDSSFISLARALVDFLSASFPSVEAFNILTSFLKAFSAFLVASVSPSCSIAALPIDFCKLPISTRVLPVIA